MKKHISLLLFAGALTWGACDKAMEDNLPSEFASVLYFDLKDGKNIIDCKLLKTGDKGQYTFYVGKGGNQLGTTAEAELVVLTKEELEEYNENSNSNYTLLPTEYYSFAEKLSFTGEDMRKGVDVMFETSNMDNELEANKQYVLPIRLESQINTVNKELDLLIVKPFITTPLVTLDLSAYQKISMNITMPEVTSQTIVMPFFVDLNENKWNFSVELEKEADALQAAVNEYKQNNTGADTYQLLPSDNYTMPSSIAFNEGELLVTENLVIDRGDLPEGDYLLPIKLKKCVGTDFDVDTKTMYVHLSLNQDLPEINLESALRPVSDNPDEGRQVGNLLDGNPATYWQTRWKYDSHDQRPNDPKYGLWLDLELTSPINSFSFAYQTPSTNNDLGTPKEFAVYVGNSIDDMTEVLEPIATFEAGADGLPNGQGIWFESDVFRSAQSFKYIRFAFLKPFQAGKDFTQKVGGSIWLAEFKLYGR